MRTSFPAKASRKNDRYFLSRQHLIEANRNLDVAHARAKREGRTLGSFHHKAWSCGCCVDVLERDPIPAPVRKQKVDTSISTSQFRSLMGFSN
jgi:hypothetical protein